MSIRRQGIFWLLTVPQHEFTPYLPAQCSWIRGQLELGAGGFLHWQVCVAFVRKVSLAGVSEVFGRGIHCELSRSSASRDYVWKESTRVAGTQFELGVCPIAPASKRDWESIWLSAQSGDFLAIPAHVRIQSYRTLRAIASDFAKPIGMVRTSVVYWGPTGTGKSRRAWEEAGMDAYPKDPRTKWWSGYNGQKNVVIDEFRGGIDICHLLRWLDRYPVSVEIKGSSTPLLCERFWFTSNVSPDQWYPLLDGPTVDALLRRLEVIEIQ